MLRPCFAQEGFAEVLEATMPLFSIQPPPTSVSSNRNKFSQDLKVYLFISEQQAKQLQEQKVNIKQGKAIVIMDYAKTLSLNVHDAPNFFIE